MRTKPLAALTLALSTALATAQPPPPKPPFPPDHPVSVIDPKLPAHLHVGLRHQFLDELEHALSSLVRGVRTMRSESTETLVLWADAGQLEKARRLTDELRTRLLARVASDQTRPERDGAPVRTVVQVVVASSQPGKPRNALDPKLAGPLSKAMGYSRFDVVGHAMAEGAVNEETKIYARMPWTDEHPVGLQVLLVPVEDDGHVRVKAQFSVASDLEEVVHEEEIEYDGPPPPASERREEEEEYEPELVEGSVETTYRPRAGKPLVVGATPMGGGRSLLFVVTHSGEGVE